MNKKILRGGRGPTQGFAMSDALVWIAVLAVIVSIAIKFVPHYVEHQTASGVIERLVDSPDSRGLDARELKTVLEKRFKMNSLEHFITNDWVTVVDSGRSPKITLAYEVRDELLVNIDFVIKFDDRPTPTNE